MNRKPKLYILGGGLAAVALIAAALIATGVFREDGPDLVNEKELGQPVYPGLTMIGWGAGGESEIDGVTVTMLPVTGGQTRDPLERVLAFYTDRLPDWNRREIGGAYFFWPGDPAEDFDPTSPRAGTRPLIAIERSEDFADQVLVTYATP